MSNRRKRPTLDQLRAENAGNVSVSRSARKPMRLSEIALALAADQAAGNIPRRVFKAPDIPPGVVPKGARLALDSAAASGMYGWLNGQAGWCGLGFPGYTYLSELAQRSEYQSPTTTMAKELTREWVNFTGAPEPKLKELRQAFQDFNVQACFRQCAVYDGFFGRGQLYVNIKGQDSDQRRKLPLVVDDENKGVTIPKGSLLGFKPIEPIWTTPYMYNSVDPTAPDFYNPPAWYVLGKQTHSSRLLTFVSRPLPDILKPAYNFSGMSLSQLIEPYVVRWLKTVDSVNRLLSNFSTTGIMTNMEATLQGDSSELLKRIQVFNQMRDNRGTMVLDKDTEEMFQFNVPLSGLHELQAQAQEHMAAPTHIPLVKLTGITPAGLNASADGEIKVFYDYVGSEQQDLLDPNLTVVSKIIQLHLWGKVDPDIKAEWVPLDSPTDKEESEMRKADGDRDKGYVDSGIVSPDEVRERLRNNPRSGYTFLKGDAPAPPLEQEHELGQAAAEADHERGEASAEADHARQKDAATHAAKIAPKPAPAKK